MWYGTRGRGRLPPQFGGGGSPIVVGGPVVLYTNFWSGPTSGGEGNNGAYLSIFGVNFGASLSAVSVNVGGAAVARVIRLVSCRGRPDIQQIDVQVGSLGGAPVGTALPIEVSISGKPSNTGWTFTPISGRMVYVDYTAAVNGSGSFASPYNTLASWFANFLAGDHCILRAGTLTAAVPGYTYGSVMLTPDAAHTGTASQPCALMGYPGEDFTFSSTSLTPIRFLGTAYDQTPGSHDAADYWSVSNLILLGGSQALDWGGRGDVSYYSPSDPRCKGSFHTWVVNCDCRAQYGAGVNTDTGCTTVKGDNCLFAGNRVHDTGVNPAINNNHGTYHQVGSSNTDICYNYYLNNYIGHVIQTHTDNAFTSGQSFQNCRRFGNLITHTDSANGCRGMNIGAIGSGSSILDFDNIEVNVGQGFSGVAVYTAAGTKVSSYRAYNNTYYGIDASVLLVSYQVQAGGNCPTSIDFRNNILHPKSSAQAYVSLDGGATVADLTNWDHNCYWGGSGAPPVVGANDKTVAPTFVNNAPDPTNPGAYDFHLVAGSSCIDAGFDSSAAAPLDYYGTARPVGASCDIGASEQ